MPERPGTKAQSCPETILDLIERFELHRETYQRETYNETQVRREFIDPFFKSLGWDIDNEQGHAEAYKEVIHEDAIKVGGSTKAPDYCFRIGGVRKFFVEAKKPSVSVGDDPAPAYQLRRYAWTNKLPLSIVTDFEELAVYDCRIKPKPDDKPSTARVLYLKCDEYPKRWDEIASIFSKDSILKGSFDKYAESNKRKRGTAEVDDEFLKEIESWRDELARSIALRNPNLSVRDLNYAVGKTIDRLIFLRMCEDRGVETYAQLRLLLNGPRVYPRLLDIFYKADQRYNSGLFHFEPEKNRPDPPDNLTPNLTIDDAVLKEILKNLYYPQCPYEFSVMPPEILGQVYEQFLGKVITLTAGHRAKVEYKPEVKKAGGVYYTPKYIVDYIVEHTVGMLLEGKTPADVGPMLDASSNPKRQRGVNPSRPPKADQGADDQSGERKRPDCLRILDPACGSGSFLLGAYQVLLDWHLKWYSEHDAEKWAKKKSPPIYEVSRVVWGEPRGSGEDGPLPSGRGSDRSWRLTITEKKRILLANIYGVDIDPQAVEVTKLSLLLKVLEGESQQTLDNQLRLFHERALPDLGGNIKCGNSLIGPDFYENQQLELLDDEERYRINVFDWHAEFPEVFQSRAPVQSRARKEAVNQSGERERPDIQNRAHIQNRDSHGAVQQSRARFQSRAREGAELSQRARKEADSPSHDDETAPLPHGRGSDQNGGFDAVIGNPPYGMVTDNSCKRYLEAQYKTTEGRFDNFELFIEKGVNLCRREGMLGYIVPSPILTNLYSKNLRLFLLERTKISEITNFGMPVFRIPTVHPCIIIVSNSSYSAGPVQIRKQVWNPTELSGPYDYQTAQTSLGNNVASTFDVFIDKRTSDVLEKIGSRATPLGELCFIRQCIKTGNDDEYVKVFARMPGTPWMPTLRGKAIARYQVLVKNEYVKYGDWLARNWKNVSFYERRKIAIRETGNRIVATIDDDCRYFLSSLYAIYPKTDDDTLGLEFLLGILNSRFATFVVRRIALDLTVGAFTKMRTNQLARLPIRTIALSNKSDKAKHDRMVELVQRMLDLHKQLAAAKTPSDQTAIRRQIDATDRQIDQLVYELYGLSAEEIRIVEETTNK